MLMCCWALLLGLSSAQAFQLVLEGEPAAVIQIDPSAGPAAHEAAAELQRVIERISGARLPIYFTEEFHGGNHGPTRFTNRILVGDGPETRAAGVNPASLEPEGFEIHLADRRLILAGRDDPHQDWHWRGHRTCRYLRGSAYAVYSFLEHELGVRWLWPGQLGEVVRHMETIDVQPINRTEAPQLPMRIIRNNWYNAGMVWQVLSQNQWSTTVWVRQAYESDQWIDHLRVGNSRSLPVSAEVFNPEWLDEFGQTHPEYFALQPNGQRLLTSAHGRVRMCLSNSGVIDEVVRRANEAFDENPVLEGFGLSLCDVYGSYCVCPDCQAWGPTLSDLVARFYIACAEKVARTHPDKFLIGYAYHKYIDPPKTVDGLPENLIILVVGQNTFGYLAQSDHERSLASWRGWAKLSANPMIWRPNNFYGDVGLPVNYTHKLADDLRLFCTTGLGGTDMDSMRRYWSGVSLTYYVTAKLLWDPQADVDAIIDDYCDRGFGAAAQAMRNYFDHVEQLTNAIAAFEQVGHHPMGVPGENERFGIAYHYRPAVTDRLHELLAQAKATTEDPTVLARISFIAKAVDYARIEYDVNRIGRTIQDGDTAPATLAQAKQLLQRRQEFLEMNRDSWACDAELNWRGADWLQSLIDEQAVKDAAWHEYKELLTLDGPWRFRTDPQQIGAAQQWFMPDHDDSSWDRLLTGQFWEEQGYADYDGAAWYRVTFQMPADVGPMVLLGFGAADETAHVYLDGRLAGTYDEGLQGWDKPFTIDISGRVQAGQQCVLAVKVVDTAGGGGLWRPVKLLTNKD